MDKTTGKATDSPANKTADKTPAISRAKLVILGGLLSIVANFLLSLFELVVGLFSNSIAIISEAAHGLLDSVSGLIVAISGKISAHKSEEQSAVIEKIATWLIVLIIFATGITTLVESIGKLITPEEVDYTAPTFIVLAVTILGKLALGLCLRHQGHRIHSKPLIASGVESLNDSLISIAVLFSALIYLIWGLDISAYVGIGISILIFGFGVSLLAGHGHHIKRTPHCHH